MSRFRLYPTPEQDTAMREHCAHARYVWNLALEQLNYRSRWQRSPDHAEQGRQLAEARTAFDWLGAGSCIVQQQALRDFDQAAVRWRQGKTRRPTWRKKGGREGFRIVGAAARRVRTVNHRWSQVNIPKVGWVKIRRTRDIPDAKSYRVTLDAAGRWHIAFAAYPAPVVPGPGTGTAVGVDRGVAITLACSDGSTYQAPTDRSVIRLQRKLARARRGSNRRAKTKAQLTRAHARNADRRRDFVEKASTDLARRFDLIVIEDLRIQGMTRSARGTLTEPGRNVSAKASLNRAVRASGWSAVGRRLESKAPGRIVKVNPAFTSQRCSGCGNVAAENRQSQAIFACVACGHTSNADLNAARNIEAAGRAARGGPPLGGPVNREPRHVTSLLT